MFYYLSKILPLFVYPLGLACLLLLGLLAADLRRRTWNRRTTITLIAFLLLWLGGNHTVAHTLMVGLENQYPLTAAPQAEVIVLLGGGTRPPFPPRQLPEVTEAGDRIFYAAELFRQEAAPHVLVSGGNIGWLRGSESGGTEADDMTALLTRLGVPQEAIWLESAAQNTYENALLSGEILREKGIRRLILVTSAFHMPRAVTLFEKQGFEVIPAPADFFVTVDVGETDRSWSADDLAARIFYLLPQGEHLETTTTALKEYLGLVVYRLRGWL